MAIRRFVPQAAVSICSNCVCRSARLLDHLVGARQDSMAAPLTQAALAVFRLMTSSYFAIDPKLKAKIFQLDGALRTLRELIVLGGHEDSVWSAAFSPDGKRIVTASRDKTARLWDGETGKPLGETSASSRREELPQIFIPSGTPRPRPENANARVRVSISAFHTRSYSELRRKILG
jgi:hypothetical protein